MTIDMKAVLASQVSNLDWLDVSQEDYRALDTLPKKNLDIAPDLIEAWGRSTPSTGLVPNTGAVIPKTMLDLAPTGDRDPYPEGIVRTARLLVIQAKTSQEIVDGLTKRFPLAHIKSARTALAPVLAERGLLGRYYLDAKDFPQCAKSQAATSKFASQYAGSVKYLVAKTECADCRYSAKNQCAVFQKELVPVVPFTEVDADQIEQYQGSRGLQAAVKSVDPRERIRQAFLASPVQQTGFSGIPNVAAGLIPAAALLRKAQSVGDRDGQQAQVKQAAAAPVVALVRRELLKGRSQRDTFKALRLSFDLTVLRETAAYWEPVFKTAGLYGVAYATSDSFTDCREGAKFLAKHASQVRVVVAGDKCTGCRFANGGACQAYGKRLVASVDEALTPDTVQWVIENHRLAGKLPWDAASRQWGNTPQEALQAVHKVATSHHPYVQTAPTRGLREGQRLAFAAQSQTSDLTVRDVVKQARHLMNAGLHSTRLVKALSKKFDKRDILASADALKPVLAEQGLMGHSYIDPTAYQDYGTCREAAKLYRGSKVKLAKMGDKCATCMGQQVPGKCSVLHKQLVAEVTYPNGRIATQKAVLASATQAGPAVNNGADMMAEFGMGSQQVDIDLKDPAVREDFPLEFNNETITF